MVNVWIYWRCVECSLLLHCLIQFTNRVPGLCVIFVWAADLRKAVVVVQRSLYSSISWLIAIFATFKTLLAHLGGCIQTQLRPALHHCGLLLCILFIRGAIGVMDFRIHTCGHMQLIVSIHLYVDHGWRPFKFHFWQAYKVSRWWNWCTCSFAPLVGFNRVLATLIKWHSTNSSSKIKSTWLFLFDTLSLQSHVKLFKIPIGLILFGLWCNLYM